MKKVAIQIGLIWISMLYVSCFAPVLQSEVKAKGSLYSGSLYSYYIKEKKIRTRKIASYI